METTIQQAVAAHQEGRIEEAERLYRSVLENQPTNLDVNNNLGVLLYNLGRLEEAEASFKKVIELKPDYVEAHYNLGITLQSLDKFNEAEASYRKAIELKPDYLEAHYKSGITLYYLSRLYEAEVSFRKAIELKSDYVEAYYNLGITLYDLNRLDEAEASYKKAIELKPDYVEAHYNLGNTLKKFNRLDEAEASYRKAIELKSDYAEAHNNLGGTLKELNRLEEAELNFRKAIALKPDIEFLLGSWMHTKMHLCMWDDFSSNLHKLIKKINNKNKVISPFALLSLIDEPSIHKKAAEIYSNNRFPKLDVLPKLSPYPNHKKIRIGYFSPDFKNHPVSFLTAELYEIHDRNQFEIHAFSFGIDTKDEINIRIKAGVDYFHDVQMMLDHDVVKLARSLEIDIAIDLAGFTGLSRTNIFAMSAAPIQVNYLGYPGTMAVDYIDYLIADHTVIPNDKKIYYSEKIVFMPNSYQPNDSKTKVSKKSFTRKDFGLPETGFVFCCINTHYKINPNVFAGWMNILSKVERSVLWLSYGNNAAINHLKKEAKKFGINEDRLVFAPFLSLREDHLGRIKLADLFLDTLPFNAHATAVDALYVGLPLLTCTGNTFAGRVATSLLKAVNLPEMITASEEEYISTAINLAKNPEKLKIIKDKLIDNLPTAPLFNSKLFTSHIEAAYKIMHDRNQKGLDLDDIEIDH